MQSGWLWPCQSAACVPVGLGRMDRSDAAGLQAVTTNIVCMTFSTSIRRSSCRGSIFTPRHAFP